MSIVQPSLNATLAAWAEWVEQATFREIALAWQDAVAMGSQGLQKFLWDYTAGYIMYISLREPAQPPCTH